MLVVWLSCIPSNSSSLVKPTCVHLFLKIRKIKKQENRIIPTLPIMPTLCFNAAFAVDVICFGDNRIFL